MSNFSEIIKEEICLEGLDGISLEGLWQRLKTRMENQFYESPKIYNTSWNFIKSQACFEFYKLSRPRGPIGPETLKYKVQIVDGTTELGTCEDPTRKEITANALAPLSYEQVMEKYGNHLVIVADHRSRYKTLIPDHIYLPPGTLTSVELAILERVGRSRFEGERTAGSFSLMDIVPDPRSMFHRREILRKWGLVCIRKVPFNNNNVLCLHLPRFTKGENEFQNEVMREIVQEAEEATNRTLLSTRVRALFEQGNMGCTWKVFRKSHEFNKYFEKIQVEKMSARKNSMVYLHAYKLKPAVEKEGDDETEKKRNRFLNVDGQYYGMPMAQQVLVTIETYGLTGTTHSEISQILGIAKPTIRNAIKALQAKSLIEENKRQVGSVVSIYYISARLKQLAQESQPADLKSALTIPRLKVRPIETPMDLSMVDVYGITTAITVKRVMVLCKSSKIDTELRLKRLKTTYDVVKSGGITVNLQMISRKVSISEGTTVCRKITQRLLQELINRGLANIYTVTFVREKETKVTSVVCDSTYHMQHERFQELLSVLHKKMVPMVSAKLQKLPQKKLDMEMRMHELRTFNWEVLRPLHKMLMNIVWFNTTDPLSKAVCEPLKDLPQEWQKQLKSTEILAPAYVRELGYQTFVAPQKSSSTSIPGWISVQELTQIMPLKLVHELYKPIEKAPNVPELLTHPIKQYYMANQLPIPPLHQHKWFLQCLLRALHKLCFVGLVRLGSSEGSGKDEDTVVYLNRKTTLTSTETPIYTKVLPPNQVKTTVQFNSPLSVDQYWVDFEQICMETLLPRRKMVGYVGSARELESILSPIAMEDGPRLDTGSLPGDGTGAAGMHGRLRVHIPQYWNPYYHSVDQRPNLTRMVERPKRKAPRVRNQKPRIYRKIFDDVDVHARDVTGLRSKWTTAEDTALLLARLANHHLCSSRGNMGIVSCVAYRDVLHWMCQSLDKSAKMCSRRVQFLCKNEVTKTTIEMCLKEMKSTKVVTSRFGPDYLQTLKKMYGNEDEFVSAVKISFVELVHILSKIYSKFTATAFHKRAGEVLPDTTEEFLRRYEINEEKDETAVWDELEGDERIMVQVVYNVIHSSMCCARDNVSYNMILLDVYKNYPEHILAHAMEKARMGLISKFKINHQSSQRTIPLNTQPFHLSVLYTRTFSTTIHYNNLEMVDTWIEEARNGDGIFSGIARSFAFFFLGLSSRQAIDVTLSEPTAVRKGILADSTNEDVKNSSSMTKHAKKSVTFRDDIDIFDFDYEPTELMLKLNLINWHILCFLKEAFEMKSEDNKKKKMEIKDDRCNFSCAIDTFKGIEEIEELLNKLLVRHYKDGIRKAMSDLQVEREKLVAANKKDLGKISALKRTSYKYVALLDDIARDMVDPLVQRVCQIKLKDGLIFPRQPCKDLINNRLRNWARINEPTKGIDLLFHGDERSTALDVLELIKTGNSLGVSGGEIIQRFNALHIDLERIIGVLLDEHWILYCGTEDIRLVHKDFKGPWIITTFELRCEEDHAKVMDSSVNTKMMYLRKRRATETTPEASHPKQAKVIYYDDKSPASSWREEKQKEIQLRVFPWIRVTGSLNDRVVDRLIGTLLIYLQGMPGAPMRTLFAKFMYIDNAHLKLLLWVMKDMGLVQLFKCSPSKVSLFSTYEKPSVEPATVLDNSDDVYIEPLQDSVLTYCELRGKRDYKRNYF